MASKSNVLQIVINGVNRAGPAFKSVAKGVGIMAAAVTAAFTAAAFSAGKFEKGLAEISTLLDGDVAPAMGKIRRELLQMSTQFGQTLDDMTKARYDVISAGFVDTADSAMVLNAASRLAVAGISDVATASDLVTSALNGLALGADQSGRVADVLFQTIRKGKTTLTELGQGFGRVFGTAAEAGVSLEELGAVMATVTAAGVDTSEAITGLNALMLAIAAPTSEAADALTAAGVDIENGFTASLLSIGEASEGGLDKLRALIPSVEALRVAAKAAGDVETMTANLQAMADSAGVVDDGVKKMEATFSQKFAEMKASAEALKVELGDVGLPVFKRVFDKIRDGAIFARFLFTEVRDGTPLWKDFVAEVIDSVPGLKAVGGTFGWLGDRMQDLNRVAGKWEFTARVNEVMRNHKKLFPNDFQKKNFLGITNTDYRALRAYSEEIVRAQDAAEGKPSEETFTEMLGRSAKDATAELRAMIDEINAAIDAAATPAVTPSTKKDLGPFIPEPGPGDRLGPPAPGVSDAAVENNAENSDQLKEDLESLTEYTKEDFANMAFIVGQSMADVVADVGAALLGLAHGPIMVGRAFKSMARMILNELARVIARMLVAKALLSLFGLGAAAGAGAGGQALGPAFASGGTLAAASGRSLGFSPAFVLPGAAGLDRTLVRGHGGETMIPRQSMEAIDRARKKAQTALPFGGGESRRGRGRKIELVTQVNRPYRIEEQNQLRDSVVEGLARAERYRG